MVKGKGYLLAVVIAAATGGSLVAGCSGSISIGSSPSVPKASVENEVATTLAQQLNQPVPKVVCPGDLTAKVGTVMYCNLTAQGSTTVYPVKVTVESVSGSQAHFGIVVSSTPNTFTAPS
jgi:hypothetical protein